ncbi:MAG TPA: hypothetical protein VF221_04225, partial [Chloroflexota bacterium]
MTAIDTPAVDTDTTIQTLWKTLDLVNASTQFADTKGATILLVDGALATVTTARLVDAHSLLNKNYPLIALVVLGGLLWLASLYFAIQCVR